VRPRWNVPATDTQIPKVFLRLLQDTKEYATP
jgi:hypothetical protein